MKTSEVSPSAPPALPLSKMDVVLPILRNALLLISLPFGILNFVLPIYGREVGASAIEIGLLFSVFSLMTVLLRPLVGSGLDRYGRRRFFIAGLFAYGLSMVGFAYAAAVWGLVTARVLQGVGSALLWLAANAIIADLAGAEERGRAFGSISQSSNQGGILGTFVGFSILVPLGLTEGWRQLFLGYAAIGLFAVIYTWRRLPETRTASGTASRAPILEGLRDVLHSRSLLVLHLVGLITGAAWAMTSPILLIFLQERFHAGVEQLAWAFLPSALVWAVLPTRLGYLSDRIGRKPLLILALIVAGINMFLIPSVNSLILLAVLWVVEAVCSAASEPAGQALITDLSLEERRGRIFGLYALAGGLGATVGPLAGGWLYDRSGQATPFIANGAALLACALILWVLLKEK